LEQRQIAFREALSNLDGSAPPIPAMSLIRTVLSRKWKAALFTV
jgi:hypothetical protein